MKLSTETHPLFFGPEHRALAEKLYGLAEVYESIGHDAARAAVAMGAHGLYALLVPKEEGGKVDVRSLCLVREMLAYTSPTADSIFAVQGLGSYAVTRAGTPEQRATLADVVSGELIGGFGLTEPEAGSDVASLRTRAELQGDTYVLTGEKVFISNVGIARRYVVFANARPDLGRKGITAFLVEKGDPGFHEEPITLAASHPIGRLVFDDARIPATRRVGDEGQGFSLAMQTLDTFRTTVGAAAVGMASRAVDESVARVKARVQFGKPLAEQPLVQAKLAAMKTKLEASRLLVLAAAWSKDEEDKARHTTEVSMAKLFSTESAFEIIDQAVQLHGGLGVVAGTVVERLTRDVRPLRIYEGTSEVQHLIIGSAMVQ